MRQEYSACKAVEGKCSSLPGPQKRGTGGTLNLGFDVVIGTGATRPAPPATPARAAPPPTPSCSLTWIADHVSLHTSAIRFQGPIYFFQGKMQQGRTDSVRPSNDQDWLLKIKLFRVCSMATRLIRVLRTCALGALVFNALFPLDAICGRKLLYSNPRLPRSSRLGETCPA
jgi:hypothetical protein